MNIVTQQFTKEQYKALYEAQQLGVRFDCWLLAPGVRIDGLTVIDERTHQLGKVRISGEILLG